MRPLCVERPKKSAMAEKLSENTAAVYRTNTVSAQVAGGSAFVTIATIVLRLEQRCAKKFKWHEQPPLILKAGDQNPLVTYSAERMYIK